MKSTAISRCPWCGSDPLYVHYHDTVWGVPEYNPKALYAKLVLDGAQAGLSWITILRRQEGYMAVFDGLDPEKVARYTDKKLEKILLDERIIREHSRKWSVRTPDDPKVFWISVHKARTACRALPREARLLSKQWLSDRGFISLDSGELDQSTIG